MNCENCGRRLAATCDGKLVNGQPIYISPESTVQIVCTDCCEKLSVEDIIGLGDVWFEANHMDNSFEARAAVAEGKYHFRSDVEYLKGVREYRAFIPAPFVID